MQSSGNSCCARLFACYREHTVTSDRAAIESLILVSGLAGGRINTGKMRRKNLWEEKYTLLSSHHVGRELIRNMEEDVAKFSV